MIDCSLSERAAIAEMQTTPMVVHAREKRVVLSPILLRKHRRLIGELSCIVLYLTHGATQPERTTPLGAAYDLTPGLRLPP